MYFKQINLACNKCFGKKFGSGNRIKCMEPNCRVVYHVRCNPLASLTVKEIDSIRTTGKCLVCQAESRNKKVNCHYQQVDEGKRQRITINNDDDDDEDEVEATNDDDEEEAEAEAELELEEATNDDDEEEAELELEEAKKYDDEEEAEAELELEEEEAEYEDDEEEEPEAEAEPKAEKIQKTNAFKVKTKAKARSSKTKKLFNITEREISKIEVKAIANFAMLAKTREMLENRSNINLLFLDGGDMRSFCNIHEQFESDNRVHCVIPNANAKDFKLANKYLTKNRIPTSQCTLLPVRVGSYLMSNQQQQKQQNKKFDFIWLDYCNAWFSTADVSVERDINLALRSLRAEPGKNTYFAVTFCLRDQVRMDDDYYQDRVIDMASRNGRNCVTLYDRNYNAGLMAYMIFLIC